MRKKLQLERINNYYQSILENISISFFTSMIGGVLSAILVSILMGQSPSEVYKKFSLPLIFWGLIFLVIFFVFWSIFWISIFSI